MKNTKLSGSAGSVLPRTSRQRDRMSSAAKHWVFTLNDINETLSYESVVDMIAPACDYLVFQQERGENGTLHYQGYAEFKKPERLSSLQKLHPILRPHWEKRKGTRQQARNYAMKEDTRIDGPWVSGDKPWNEKSQGRRSDLEDLVKMVEAGHTDREIFDAHPVSTFKHLRHITAVRMVFKPVRTTDLSVVLLYGPPDTGKTRAFWDLYPDGFSVPVSKNLWFSNYQQEKAVLIDDFAGNIGLTQLLQILDRYPVQLETKGSHTWWCPDVICITSNLHPFEWYDYSTRANSYKALKRRVTRVVVHGDDDTPNRNMDKDEFFDDMRPTETRWSAKQHGPVTHFDGQ